MFVNKKRKKKEIRGSLTCYGDEVLRSRQRVLEGFKETNKLNKQTKQRKPD